MSQTYDKLIQQLFNINRFHPKKCLSTMQLLAQHMKNPEKKLNLIHITGTNGKGSVAKKLAKCFQYSGYKTGIFTSPHLFDFRERIQINDTLIDKNFVLEKLQEYFAFSEYQKLPITFFEYVTQLCFDYFQHEKVDIGIVEAGIGARLDATNIINPKLSVITSVGFDHQDQLGSTLKQITEEKSYIIKSKIPCLIGPSVDHIEVVKKRASEFQSKLHVMHHSPETTNSFIEENKAITYEAIKILKNTYSDINKNLKQNAIHLGIEEEQPFRMQEFCLNSQKLKYKKQPKKIFIDVGHNISAIEKVFQILNTKYSNIQKRVVYGASYTKDSESILKFLAQNANSVHLVQAHHNRALNIQVLQSNAEHIIAKDTSLQCKFERLLNNGQINLTIDDALQKCSINSYREIIIIIGSFYIMDEVVSHLKQYQ